MKNIMFRAWDGKVMHQNVVIVDEVAYKRDCFASIFSPNAKAGIPMQYTGLNDKHGEDIFEGDILRNVLNPLVNKDPFAISWDNNSGCWYWYDGEDGTDPFYQSIADDCEIIGNIYENSELITK